MAQFIEITGKSGNKVKLMLDSCKRAWIVRKEGNKQIQTPIPFERWLQAVDYAKVNS